MNIRQLFLFLVLPIAAFGQGNTYIIKGTVKHYFPGQKVYIVPLFSAKGTTDSVVIENGHFTFTGVIDESIPPEDLQGCFGDLVLTHDNKGLNNLFVLYGKQPAKDVKFVHLLPGITEVEIVDSIYKAKIKASINIQPYYILDSISHATVQKMSKIISEWAKEKDTSPEERMSQFDKQSKIFNEEETRAKWQFVKDYPNSTASLYILNYDIDHNQNPDYNKLAPYYYGLSSELKETKFGKEYGLMLKELKNIKIGVTAPDFTLNDVNGTPVSLSSFKGKYVLIDFWAPWAVDNRVENANVVTAYNNFKAYNFTVLGVSLCGKRSDWLDYIRVDKLPWTEVSDLKGLNGEAPKLYAIKALPQNFLIDPDGKIIAKNLFGNGLAEKLAQIFKN